MLIEVALPLPVPGTFTYELEDGTSILEGTRVLVPFGGRKLIGWVAAAPAEPTAVERIRPVSRVLDPEPSVPPELLRVARWVADYYAAPLGQVLRTALPAVLSRAGRPDPAVKHKRLLRLTRELASLRQRDELFARAPRQRECYELLESMGGEAETGHLTQKCGYSAAVLQGLIDKQLVELVLEEVGRDPFAESRSEEAPNLRPTAAQAAVLDRLKAAGGAGTRPFLLRGVTGSGKTLVYIELLEEVVRRRGQSAIVLVPEIALTPQTVARFRSRFGDAVAVLHSALSDGERYDAWRAVQSGARSIVVGARSAVFAPVRNLGAIIVDEEHEGSYKQGEAPRYHAREIAIVRAGLAGALCLLGSATPSLESWHNATTGKFELLELPERIGGRPLPPVRIVDLREERRTMATPGNGARAGAGAGVARSVERGPELVLAPPLIDALQERLDRGEQSILLLNRRGYATFVQCRSCGAVWECPRCSVSLTFHRARRRLVCHHCLHHEPSPTACDACGSTDLSFRGVGTEQVERTVADSFPAARLARMDVDTTSGKWAHHRILERFERREIDILLGTQMIAKGLDFPNVTLVGVVNADVGLNLPDFRATERTFQLLTQVAGRAGRGPLGGEVLIQSWRPNHYVLRTVVGHDYAGFVERELAERGGPGYPPFARMVNVVISGTEEATVQEACTAAAAWVRARMGDDAAVVLTGPAPCPIERVKQRWRWHFLLRSASPRRLGALCHHIQSAQVVRPGRADLRLIVDRDPVAVL